MRSPTRTTPILSLCAGSQQNEVAQSHSLPIDSPFSPPSRLDAEHSPNVLNVPSLCVGGIAERSSRINANCCREATYFQTAGSFRHGSSSGVFCKIFINFRQLANVRGSQGDTFSPDVRFCPKNFFRNSVEYSLFVLNFEENVMRTNAVIAVGQTLWNKETQPWLRRN